jgi:superfamily II DNA/RNA helicase
VAARGLDMPNIDWIIQYNTPGSCVDYVHRVGRTARVGHKGKAVIFLEPCEVEYLKELNKLGISLRETKLDSVMDCLNDEAKYYPRQVNSDRVSVEIFISSLCFEFLNLVFFLNILVSFW